MELFLSLLGLWSKNLFYKIFLIFPSSLKLIFKPGNRIIQQEIELFLPLPGLWLKNFLYKACIIWSKGFKLIFKTGNGNTQTGNGIISPTFRPPMKKLLLQHIFYLFQSFQNWFSKQEMELSKQEMELFPSLPDLWSKNFFYKMFFICSKGFKIDFGNRKWNYSNRKWNYSSYFQTSDN